MIRYALFSLRDIALGLAFVLAVNTSVFANYYIPSESMMPTLLVGDSVVVSKFPYGYSRYSMLGGPPLFDGRIFEQPVTRGDVVVFKHPCDNSTDLIKRIVGVPGDVIETRMGRLLINGAPVPVMHTASALASVAPMGHQREVRESIPDGPSYLTLDLIDGGPGDNRGPFVVPTGQYFAMGDNRDNSSDSRWPKASGVGFVPAENIVGRAEFILWSWSGQSDWTDPTTWPDALRFGRTFTSLR